MPITCRINFENNPRKIVFSGQKLHLTVRLKLTEETKVRGIYIQLHGTAHVHFSADREGYIMKDENVFYTAKYLTTGNDEIQVIPVGTHDYSFTYTLPADLPSSISSRFGQVKYIARVTLRIPLWPNKKFEQKFFIFKTVNLNDDPSLRAASIQESGDIWSRYSDFVTMGRIHTSARIPTDKYSYGQSIDLQVTVNNQTQRTVDKFIVYIIRRTLYQTYSRYFRQMSQKTVDNIVQKWTMIGWISEASSNKTFPTVGIVVPALIPPTDTQTSNIIKIRYFISVKGFLGDQLVSSSTLPIVIGTIPSNDSSSTTVVRPRTTIDPSAPLASVDDIWASETFLMEPSAPVFPDDDTVSIRTYASTPPPFPDEEFDLPTYEQALLMDQEIDINLQSIEESFAQLFKSTK